VKVAYAFYQRQIIDSKNRAFKWSQVSDRRKLNMVFKAGDSVVLKSGGPLMTIAGSGRKTAAKMRTACGLKEKQTRRRFSVGDIATSGGDIATSGEN
jgi:hypothetical protein